MPKRRDTGSRKAPHGPGQPAPPARDEVERAIETIVERLKPKPRRPGAAAPRKPERKAGPPARLSLVWSRDGEGG